MVYLYWVSRGGIAWEESRRGSTHGTLDGVCLWTQGCFANPPADLEAVSAECQGPSLNNWQTYCSAHCFVIFHPAHLSLRWLIRSNCNMQCTPGHSKNSAGKKLRDTNTPLSDPRVKGESKILSGFWAWKSLEEWKGKSCSFKARRWLSEEGTRCKLENLSWAHGIHMKAGHGAANTRDPSTWMQRRGSINSKAQA